jgi:isoleucyl-tRNA synthetase
MRVLWVRSIRSWKTRTFATKNYKNRGDEWRSSLNLPQTAFPLRANAAQREIEIQEMAEFDSMYSWQWTCNSDSLAPVFCLHDGPPYANGEPHMGHALNKVLKDIICRYKMMQGYRVHYIPGWDCHGLPIELKALQSAKDKDLSPLVVRSTAYRFAEDCIKKQQTQFQRWGLLANWSNVYTTMDKFYEANQLRVFLNMYEQVIIHA